MERQCGCCKDMFRPDRYHPHNAIVQKSNANGGGVRPGKATSLKRMLIIGKTRQTPRRSGWQKTLIIGRTTGHPTRPM